MKAIFTYLLDFSVVISVAILLAILLRPALKKGPSYLRCVLWALVFLRLLVPVGGAQLPVSIPELFDAAQGTVSAPAGDAVTDDGMAPPTVQTPTGHIPDVQEPEVQLPDTQPPAVDTAPDHGGVTNAPVTGHPAPQAKEADVLFVLSVLWAAGAAAMVGYMLASNLFLRYRVRNAIVFDSRIRVIDRDCSPFVFGFFRPIIYIPASVNKADWPYIIAHETSHIKRFDHVLKPLAFLALCFYWYNPLVWAAYLLLSKDIEYACDERTVKRMENSDRRAYSLALLAVSQGENILFAPPLSFGKVSVKERVKRVMTKRVPVWTVCIAIVICVALSFLTVFTLAEAQSTENTEVDSGETSSGTGASDDAETGPRAYLLPSVIKKNAYNLFMQYEDGALTIRSDGDFYYRYTWDDKGRLTGEEFPWCHFVYEYDADGKLAVETQIDGYGRAFMRTEYTYNEFGECADAKVTVDPERRDSRQEHLYDASGNLMEEIQYDNGTDEAWRLLYRYDGNGNLLQRLQYSPHGDESILYEYDASGKRIKETCEDAEGNLLRYGLYEYDENGLCRWKETALTEIDAVMTAELVETVEVTLSEEAYKTVLRLLLEHY